MRVSWQCQLADTTPDLTVDAAGPKSLYGGLCVFGNLDLITLTITEHRSRVILITFGCVRDWQTRRCQVAARAPSYSDASVQPKRHPAGIARDFFHTSGTGSWRSPRSNELQAQRQAEWINSRPATYGNQGSARCRQRKRSRAS